MIIITGVSGGVGKKLAQELSGYDLVYGTYNNTKVEFDPGKNILTGQLDITNEESVADYFKSIDLSKVTVIHASTVSIDGLIAGYKKEQWDQTISVNITGNYLVTKHLLPAMISDRWGRIIHLSSVIGKIGEKGAVAYGMSKNAVAGLSKGLAQEYGRFNITSNVLNLGYMESGLIDGLDAHAKECIIKRIPLNKFGGVSNVANAIRFLIESDYVNGSEIDIDGGFR